MIGRKLLNYELKSELGRGGMAIVYMAEHNLTGEKVAVKVLNSDLVKNENIRKRFVSEARNLAKMSHRNIVKVRDLYEDGDTVAFVMDCIQGQTLKEILDSKGKMIDFQIKEVFLQMLDALSYVHQYGLVHRDVKPSNFMLDHQNNLFLMDFGIAKIMDATSAEYTSTGTGAQLGTPMYMSPEQVTETRNVTLHSDIYSLGVVLWQMVTGNKPYDTKSTSNFELQTKIVNEPLSYTHTKWDHLIQTSTQKNPQNRFQTTLDFRNQVMNASNSNNGDKTIFEGSGSDKTIFEGGNSEKTIYDSPPIASTPNVPPKKSGSKDVLVAVFVVVGLICLVFVGIGIYDEWDRSNRARGAEIDSTEAAASEEGSNSVTLNESEQSTTEQPADAKQDEKADYKSDYANSYDGDWPSEEEQKNVIMNFYSDFDEAFSEYDMQNYLENYYDNSCCYQIKKNEKYSYDDYVYKTHNISSIVLDYENASPMGRAYIVNYSFDFKKTEDYSTGLKYRRDLVILDQNNKIIERKENY
jgi:serine/threonine-protein kinase